MERVNMFDFFLLNEGRTPKQFRFITANEFQFIYDCVDTNGKYSSWVSSKDKNKLINRIINYLDVNVEFTEDFQYYRDCDNAREKNIASAGGDKRRKNYIKGVKEKKKNEYEEDVQFSCELVPRFMNELVPLLFNNINNIINSIKDKSRINEFISLHIDVFVNFFENRHRDQSKELPRNLLYRQLVDVYMDKPFKKFEIPNTNPENVTTKSLYIMQIENIEPNYVYNLYNYVLSGGETERNIGYLFDCTLKTEPIDKLLCVLTHNREFKPSFAFEKTFEHSLQFKPYKGNVAFTITTKTLRDQMKKNENEEEDNKIKLDFTIKKLYVDLFNIIFTDKDMIELFNNSLKLNELPSSGITFSYPEETILEILEDKLSEEIGILLKEDNDKKAKGDIKAIKPVYSCLDPSNVVIKPNSKIELKFFTLEEIAHEHNNLHITRILEPDKKYIFNNTVGLSKFNKKSKEFNTFFDLIMNSVIKVVEDKVIEFKKDIEKFSRPTIGLFVAGPKYIPNTGGWVYDIYKGKGLQRGEGVGIKLKLPDDYKAYDIEYSYETRQFCIKY
jgi:hypothetical protein